MSDFWRDLNDQMADIAGEVRRSLVQVASGRRGVGAGLIWSPDGLIITNAHVVRRHTPQVILPDGRALTSQVLAVDPDNDLAALAVDADGLPAIQPGDSQELRAGQWVMAMGHPWGRLGAMTSGVVVGAGSSLPGMPSERELVAVSLHLRPGYSGGPLVDAHGRVVGVNTMMAGPDVGLAIPTHVVVAFLEALAEYESQHRPQANPAPWPITDL